MFLVSGVTARLVSGPHSCLPVSVSVSCVLSVVLPYGRLRHAVLPQGRTTDGMSGGVCVVLWCDQNPCHPQSWSPLCPFTFFPNTLWDQRSGLGFWWIGYDLMCVFVLLNLSSSSSLYVTLCTLSISRKCIAFVLIIYLFLQCFVLFLYSTKRVPFIICAFFCKSVFFYLICFKWLRMISGL